MTIKNLFSFFIRSTGRILMILVILAMGYTAKAAVGYASAPADCGNTTFTILGDAEEPAKNRLGFTEIELDGAFACLKVNTNNASVELATAKRSNAELRIVEVDSSTFIIYSVNNRPMGSRISVMVRRFSDDPAAFGLAGQSAISGATTGVAQGCGSETSYKFSSTNETLWNSRGWALSPGVYSEGSQPGGWSATFTVEITDVEMVDINIWTPSGESVTTQGSCFYLRTLNTKNLTAWDPETGTQIPAYITTSGPGEGDGMIYLIGKELPRYIWVTVKATPDENVKGLLLAP